MFIPLDQRRRLRGNDLRSLGVPGSESRAADAPSDSIQLCKVSAMPMLWRPTNELYK